MKRQTLIPAIALLMSCSGGSGTANPGPNPQVSACTPGESRACYSGAAGTEGVGACRAGTQTCAADGLSFGPCAGEIIPAAEDCSTKTVDEDCDNDPADNACPGESRASLRFGGNPGESGRDIAVDLNGNVLMTGNFQGDVDFGSGPLSSLGTSTVFLAKYDSDLNPLWSGAYGEGLTSSAAYSVASDPQGNIVIAGAFNGGEIDFGDGTLVNAGSYDAFVAKCAPSGQILWSRSFGDADFQTADSMAIDAAGNILVSGSLRGTADFGSGPLTSAGESDAYVLKLDPSGALAWARRFGDAAAQSGDAVASDPQGNVVLAGSMEGTADFGSGPLNAAGNSDVFVAKFDPAGNPLWSRRFGDAAYQYAFDAVCGDSGDIYLSGGFEGQMDFGSGPVVSAGGTDAFAVKLDAGGNAAWSLAIGGPDNEISGKLAVNGQSLLITGGFSGSMELAGAPIDASGGSDAFALRVDGSGGALWARQFGGPADDSATASAVAADNGWIVMGSFGATADFGAGPLVSDGIADIFLLSLAP